MILSDRDLVYKDVVIERKKEDKVTSILFSYNGNPVMFKVPVTDYEWFSNLLKDYGILFYGKYEPWINGNLQARFVVYSKQDYPSLYD